MPLTVLEVKNAKPKDRPYKLTDGKGLVLHVSPSGKKTWRYRFTIAGTESTFVLGEYPVLTLELARLKRAEAREMVKAGINPGEERRVQKQAVLQLKEAEKVKSKNSFEAVALEWHKKNLLTGSRITPGQSWLPCGKMFFRSLGEHRLTR